MKKFQTELCKIAFKYGTDKCPQIGHTYTPFYYEFFKGRKDTVKKVLELGIGHYRGIQKIKKMYDHGLNRQYHRGASLYMWRDFFPNAQIYGADYQADSLFRDDRIETFFCDERKKQDLVKLIENTGSDIDIFIDDASHHWGEQLFTCQTLMPLLSKDVVYIIEDVVFSKKLMSGLLEYECITPPILNQGGINQLIVVKHNSNKKLLK